MGYLVGKVRIHVHIVGVTARHSFLLGAISLLHQMSDDKTVVFPLGHVLASISFNLTKSSVALRPFNIILINYLISNNFSLFNIYSSHNQYKPSPCQSSLLHVSKTLTKLISLTRFLTCYSVFPILNFSFGSMLSSLFVSVFAPFLQQIF